MSESSGCAPGDEVFGVSGETVEVAAEPRISLGGRDLKSALVHELTGSVEHVQLWSKTNNAIWSTVDYEERSQTCFKVQFKDS